MEFRPDINPTDRRTILGWREYLLLTQTDLAKKIGVGKNTIYSWEHLKRMPRIKMRAVVTSVLGEYGIHYNQIIWPSEERQEHADHTGHDVASATRQAS